MVILKELRRLNNLTLRDVEEKAGISNAYLSRLENGKIKKPSASVLNKLATLYKVSLDSLLVESGKIKGQTIEERLIELEARVKKLEGANFMNIPFA